MLGGVWGMQAISTVFPRIILEAIYAPDEVWGQDYKRPSKDCGYLSLFIYTYNFNPPISFLLHRLWFHWNIVYPCLSQLSVRSNGISSNPTTALMSNKNCALTSSKFLLVTISFVLALRLMSFIHLSRFFSSTSKEQCAHHWKQEDCYPCSSQFLRQPIKVNC